jgi:hypothetical protein
MILVSKTAGPIVVLFIFATLFIANPAGAQQSASTVPDLSEIWARGGCMPTSDVCPYIETDKPLTARAKAFRDAFDELAAPKYDCVQATSPSLLIDPYNFQIEQRNDRVIFIYEKDDIVRTVWLQGHNHPEPGPYDFYLQGYSTGRYEGNQLVVETTKFSFDPTGLDDMRNLPSSTRKRVVERYWREDDRLKVDVLTEDPVFLLEPIKFGFEWRKTETPLLLPYGCDPELARQPLEFVPSKFPDPKPGPQSK